MAPGIRAFEALEAVSEAVPNGQLLRRRVLAAPRAQLVDCLLLGGGDTHDAEGADRAPEGVGCDLAARHLRKFHGR